jgi:hypothetical protein
MSGIPSWARVGAKVVCVDGDFSRFPSKLLGCAPNRPVAGITYTVRRVREYPKGVFILLEEIRNPWSDYGRWHGEAQFGLGRFRPLVALEDDISTHFRQLLDVPAHHGADA